MTTSANIAGVPGPFAPVPRGGAWPYSKKRIWTLDELKPKKKKARSTPFYGQMGMLLLRRESLEEVKSPIVTDKPGKKKDTYKFKGKVGVWRTIAGKRFFFPSDGSGSTPRMNRKDKAKLGKDARRAEKDQDRKAATISGLKSGLKDRLADAKSQGMSGRAKRIKKQIKAVKSGDLTAAGDVGKKSMWAEYAENELLPKVQAMMKKAKANDNKAAFAVLAKMEAAIKKGDEKAFKRASAGLKKAIKKTTKVVAKQKKKEGKKASKFKPSILGKIFRRKS